MKFSYKNIWLITYPILFSILMEHLIGMTDTAFLGRVGEIELGASALAGIYYLTLYMVAFGFSVGAQIIIGRRNGEGDYRKTGPVLLQGSLFLFLAAGVLFLVSKIWSPHILSRLISSEDVYRATLKYMDWRVYGFFFSFIAVMFRAFYVGITRTKILTINSIVMVLTNVLLNYVLIFGKMGFPALGIAGAAIASSVSELVSVLFFIFYTYYKVDREKYNLFHFTGIQPGILKQVLNISIWTMIQSFVALSTWFLFFLAVEHLGERQLAITNIIRSISSLLFMVIGAFASTASSLVSNLIGAGQQDAVMRLCGKIIKMCYLFILPLLVLVYAFPTLILRIYTNNPELIYSSVPSLFVMASVYLISVPANVLFNAVSGTGNTRSALGMELLTLTVYVIYMVYIVIYLKADVAICWTTEHVYAMLILALSFIYMRSGRWKNKKI